VRLEFLPGSNRSAASRNTVNIARGSVAALATGSAAPRGHAHPAIPSCNALSTIFTQSSSRTHGTQLHTHVTGHAFTCMHGLGSMELMICARQPRLGPRLPVHNLAKLKLTFGSNRMGTLQTAVVSPSCQLSSSAQALRRKTPKRPCLNNCRTYRLLLAPAAVVADLGRL
jgi:hypothetical protein